MLTIINFDGSDYASTLKTEIGNACSRCPYFNMYLYSFG